VVGATVERLPGAAATSSAAAAVTEAAHRRQWWLRRSALRDTTAVLRSGAAVLAGHWPVLLALSFAGLGARHYLLVAAVAVSKINGYLGILVLVVVPLTTLSALVLMLLAARASLPWLASALPGSRGPAPGEPAPVRRSLLDHLGSVLVPFLAVYASYGYLKDDFTDYSWGVLEDVWGNGGTIGNRLGGAFTVTLVAIVAVAVVARWLLGRWKLARRRPWLGLFGAYIEAVWVTLVAWTINKASGFGQDWLDGRRVVHGLKDTTTAVVDRLGPLAHPAHGGLNLIGTLTGSVNSVILVPVAWLAVGAVVYGYQIRPPAPPSHDLIDLARDRWLRLPAPVRRIGAELGGDLRERFGPLWFGLRLLVRTGLRPMLLFCLTFLVVQSTDTWLFMVEKWLVGPADLHRLWVPLSDVLVVLNDGVRTVLLAALLAAAVDRVLRAQASLDPAPAG